MIRPLVLAALLSGGAARAAEPSPFTTGNGYGFAVVSSTSGEILHYYVHPYRFERPDPKDALGEGVEAADLIAAARWETAAATSAFRADYVNDSHVVAVEKNGSRQAYYMPFDLERNALIASRSPGAGGCLRVQWSHPVASRRSATISGRNAALIRFDGVPETLALVPLDASAAAAKPPSVDCFPGDAWAFLTVAPGEDPGESVRALDRWQARLTPAELEARELSRFEAWRVKPAVRFASEAERRLWRQSEAVLRMAQSREPDAPGRVSRGWIVASIPGGAWFAIWVRDMAYAAHALVRMGHREEARRALEAYFRARPVGVMSAAVRGRPYQVSVARYFGNGAEEPYFTMEGSTNIELDDWGLVLWVLGEYVERFDDTSFLNEATYRGRVYDSAKKYIAEPLLANLDPFEKGLIVSADTSIWEERQKDAKHFAFSTAAAIKGLRAMDALAVRRKDRAFHRQLTEKLALLERGFRGAFIRGGAVRGTLEEGIKNEVDGAALSALNFGVAADTAVLRGTVDRMPALLVDSGGYRRVHCILTDPKIYEYYYERQEFLFVDLNLSEVYLRLGEKARAAALLERLVAKAAADHNFIPEMYVSVVNPLFTGAIGDPTGAIPMVGYGAGAYIDYLITREALSR